MDNNNSLVIAGPGEPNPLDITSRGIKSAGGSGFIIEDDPIISFDPPTTKHGREKRVEFWTGKQRASAPGTGTLPAAKHHQFIMSDALQSITISSDGGHTTVYDDTLLKQGIRTTSTYGHVINQDDILKSITVSTLLQNSFVASDVPPSIAITSTGIYTQTSAAAMNLTSGGILTIMAQGIAITSTGTAPCITIAQGISTNTFTGIVTENYNGALTQVVTGIWNMSTGILNLVNTAPNGLLFGQAQATKYYLVDERFITAYNSHTHTATGPTAVTTAPNTPVVPSTVLTSDVKAS